MSIKHHKIDEVVWKLRFKRPVTKENLRNYIKVYFDVDVPDKVVTEGHNSPLDYLWYVFGLDFLEEKPQNGDCVVWANRGGSKTQTAAIATVLDCVFKPGVQIRILSGSEYQAGRLYDYFRSYVDRYFSDMVKEVRKRPTDKYIFCNGATVEVLVQSETSIRGQHVHKLRCDEIELFKPRVFDAAQYTTMSSLDYVASLEIISTKHKPYGIMSEILKESVKRNRPVFKWNVWDVVEKCPRYCEPCCFKEVCAGKAKNSTGYYKIGDVFTDYERVKPSSFNLEMLCDEGSKKKGFGYYCRVRRY